MSLEIVYCTVLNIVTLFNFPMIPEIFLEKVIFDLIHANLITGFTLNKQDEPSSCTSLRTRSSFWAVVQEEESKQSLVILLNGGCRN